MKQGQIIYCSGLENRGLRHLLSFLMGSSYSLQKVFPSANLVAGEDILRGGNCRRQTANACVSLWPNPPVEIDWSLMDNHPAKLLFFSTALGPVPGVSLHKTRLERQIPHKYNPIISHILSSQLWICSKGCSFICRHRVSFNSVTASADDQTTFINLVALSRQILVTYTSKYGSNLKLKPSAKVNQNIKAASRHFRHNQSARLSMITERLGCS